MASDQEGLVSMLFLLHKTQFKMPSHVSRSHSKAVDLVDHEILLGKLQHYGIRGRGPAYKWFESYLGNRHTFFMGDTEIDKRSDARFLGVIMDDKLTWSKHI